jgi:hypothetical protein
MSLRERRWRIERPDPLRIILSEQLTLPAGGFRNHCGWMTAKLLGIFQAGRLSVEEQDRLVQFHEYRRDVLGKRVAAAEAVRWLTLARWVCRRQRPGIRPRDGLPHPTFDLFDVIRPPTIPGVQTSLTQDLAEAIDLYRRQPLRQRVANYLGLQYDALKFWLGHRHRTVASIFTAPQPATGGRS